MVFKYQNPTAADDILAWLNTTKQALDDYFAGLPASQRDDIERQNYLIDIEKKAKRLGYKPEIKKVGGEISGGDIDTDFVPEGTPTGRTAKAPQTQKQPQTPMVLEGDILLPKEQETALRQQFKGPNFFNDLKAAGYQMVQLDDGSNAIVPRQYAYFNKDLGEKGRTVLKPEVVEYLKGRSANAPQGVASEVVQEVPSSPVPGVPIFSRTPREEAEIAWAFASGTGNNFKPVVIDGKTKQIPWDKEEWIQNYIANNSSAPVAANAAEVVSVPQENITYSGFSVPQQINSTAAPTSIEEAEALLDALDAELTGTQPQQVVQQSIPTSIPIPDNVPPQNVNPAVYPGSKAVSTSSDLPPGGGGGGNYSFEGGEFDGSSGGNNFGQTFNKYPQGQTPGQKVIPKMDEFFRQQANTGSLWGNVWDGTKRGFQYSVDAGRIPGRTASVIWNRAPKEQYQYLTPEGRVGFLGGRVAGEIGHGTKQVLWNLFPDDFAGTKSVEVIRKAGGNRMAQVVIPYATTTALQLGSQTYNPFNLAQGGRVAGYTAINPDDEDPRISTTPISEFIVDRGFFGRRGKLLPWEQFREERPDIPYEQYQRYQDYLYNKDENLLRDVTGGLVKGTLDGINGPEVSVMGYSVTPVGALAAAGTLLAGRHLVGRTAALRV